MRIGISYKNVCDLPSFSTGPHGEIANLHSAIAQAGYEGIQDGDPELCRHNGLTLLGTGLLQKPSDADRLATMWKARGAVIVTCIAGFGMEADVELDAYAAAICQASANHQIPLLLETHRASITQDSWRTVQLCQRFPSLRFTLDLSHWFTGQEMPYGDLERRLAFLEPVLMQTSCLHGRIGDRCCMQVQLAEVSAATLLTFRMVWTKVMRNVLVSQPFGTQLWFCPELLGATYNYARQFRDHTGTLREETDRWQEADALVTVARDCFEQARLSL